MGRREHAGLVVGTIAASVVLALGGCTLSNDDPSASVDPPAPLTHVHGLGVDRATGFIYAATHGGIFRLSPLGAADIEVPGEPVGGLRQDTMGFTMVESTMFGSGHPDPALKLPPNLGLVTSTDGALSWQSVSPTVQTDFHDLAVLDDGTLTTIYGYDAQAAQVRVSVDGGMSWDARASMQARDLTVDPVGTVYATTPQGVQRSSDGARSFTILDGAPSLYLVQAIGDGTLVGVSVDGGIFIQSANGGWQRTGQARAGVDAMVYATAPTEALLVSDEQGIAVSYDSGATWASVGVFQ